MKGSTEVLKPTGLLEACLYARDLEAAEDFYRKVLGLEVYSRDPGRDVFFRCGQGMFLVFNPGQASRNGNSGVPRHGATGPGHVAFRVEDEEVEDWKAHLRAQGVEIERELSWPGGGCSLYLRDPAGNSVELATAGLWGL